MTNRNKAVSFIEAFLPLMIAWGVERSIVHRIAGIWWESIERGDFGE